MDFTGAQKVHASVKSYSQRGRLLPKNILQTLAESRDLDELVTRIKNTKYVDGISKITKPYTAEKIESTLRSHLADIHFSIAKTAGNPVLDAYYIRFLIWNLLFHWKLARWGSTWVWHAFCYTGFFRQNLTMAFEKNVLIYIGCTIV